ncbi:unnamed protein product [Adineta ricciae]|uniref:Branched-chain-amino-acid aminotransferase n=1 Tax=Adineta ricciae TaxID=249248 RepID=A0A815Z627_ADIRI|nr:unnamed protein product [Adineta ricciae]CAF1579375.1 unnamed protein product [Adineta ricciae]
MLAMKRFGLVVSQRSYATASTFRAADTIVKKTERGNPKPDPNKLVFGATYSDHMLTVKHTNKAGWEKPVIEPLTDLKIHPGAKVLHYATELFEGMKAYRGDDGKIRLFRPDLNMKRMLSTAERSVLPTFDGNELLECIKKLVQVDAEWVPRSKSSTLYIRPTLIGTEPTLGVAAPSESLLFVVTGPVGPYFPTGFKPVSLLADTFHCRAFPGGMGAFKAGSNYGPTIYVNKLAQEQGCQQVLWLYGEKRYITEVGTMNVFMCIKDKKGGVELVTPPLNGLILPGVTRQSIIDLGRTWRDFTVSERDITIDELLEAQQDNRLLEMFGAGTAAIVCPVERIVYEGKSYNLATMNKGAPITNRFHDEIVDIQFGRKPSKWTVDVALFYSLIFIPGSQSKRVGDEMYVSFDRARYCVRRLNATHEIGCQSTTRGNSGRMYMIENDEEFKSYLQDDKMINSITSFIIVMNVRLFDSSHVDQLMNHLQSKLNGLLLYLKSNSSRPEYFSSDDQCPNHRYSYYLNQTQIVNWNRKGTGLFFRSFPFPIMLIDEKDDYEQLVRFYRQFNSSHSSPACGLELKTFQNAAHTSKTCMRRNDITHSLIDLPEMFCDPIGGLNIYSKLPQMITSASQERQLKSVVLILAATDSFQMFTKMQGSTGGAQQPAVALISLLALAHLIGQVQDEVRKQNKEIVFLTIDGDTLDYSGSIKFIYDMNRGSFPMGNKNEQRIKPEHIHSIIELQALSMTDQLWLHSYPSSLVNQSFTNTLVSNQPMIKLISPDSPLPPASSQIFLRETSSSLFPAYILSSADATQLNNPYYHSLFDDPSTLSIDLAALEYNSTTKLSLWIKRVVEPLSQTLVESFVGTRVNVNIKQEIINNLVYCILKNINCPLIHNVSNQSVGNTFVPFNETPMPFTINSYPAAKTPTFPFIQHVLSYFLRDRSYDFLNFTRLSCKERASNDSFRSYRFVDGYLPSLSGNSSFPGYCVRSYLRSVQSMSPAFIIDGYDLSQTTYPAWTESRWTTTSLRLFIIPTGTHEVVTLIIGILLFSVSFFVLLALRHFTKLSLLQPSCS